MPLFAIRKEYRDALRTMRPRRRVSSEASVSYISLRGRRRRRMELSSRWVGSMTQRHCSPLPWCFGRRKSRRFMSCAQARELDSETQYLSTASW